MFFYLMIDLCEDPARPINDIEKRQHYWEVVEKVGVYLSQLFAFFDLNSFHFFAVVEKPPN